MKRILSVFLSIASFVVAQTAHHFDHIVIVVQENRTPDNLFPTCNLTGADVQYPPGIATSIKVAGPAHTHSSFLLNANGHYNLNLGATNYVQHSDIPEYCAIASSYGFANRMFQTNQGPSTPAHQFLFSGTSQPSNGSEYFEAEIIAGGCIYNSLVWYIDPSGVESLKGSACLDTTTLSDLLESAGYTWRYYAISANGLWTAPTAIHHICIGPNAKQAKCTGPDWLSHVVLNPPQVLTDIANGDLANVVWVTPAGSYSDHPQNSGGGPAWVASIVNAIGQSQYWNNTAILITWDDWGGFWDHVPPLVNKSGFCMSYCYGFRVPLLVVSAYTPVAYVDNDVHDFGSIVHFVESNFELGSLHVADAYADNLSGFFTGSERTFKLIPAHATVNTEDRSDPDDY